MSCKPFKDKLEAYCLGLLSEQEEAAIKQHVQTCATCKQELVLHEQAARLIARAFDQNPPAYIRSKVLANLKDVKQKKNHWAFWAAPGLIGVMALLLIIKMEPGQMLKKQVVETAGQEQMLAAPVSSVPQPEKMQRSKQDEKQKKTGEATDKQVSVAKKRPMLAQPAAGLADFQALGVIENKPRTKQKAAVQAEAGKEERKMALGFASEMPVAAPVTAQALAPEPEAGPAPEKREAYRAMVGAGSMLRSQAKAAPAAPLGKTVRTDDAENFSKDMESDEAVLSESGSAERQRVQTVRVSVVEIQGKLDRTQVISEVSRLDQVLAIRIKQAGELRTVQIRITVNPQGKVISAAFLEEAFVSSQLNLYIQDEIQTLTFDPSNNALPATVIIQIEVK